MVSDLVDAESAVYVTVEHALQKIFCILRRRNSESLPESSVHPLTDQSVALISFHGSSKRRHAHEKNEENDSGREYIRLDTVIELLVRPRQLNVDHFGSFVSFRVAQASNQSLRQVGLVDASEPEVDYLRPEVCTKDNVLRLDVPVYELALVNAAKTVENLYEEVFADLLAHWQDKVGISRTPPDVCLKLVIR